MHIGIDTLILRRGEYSGVHVAVRGLVRSVVDAAGPGDCFTLYAQRKLPAGLPGDDRGGEGGESRARPEVRVVRPPWPVGWRAGRIAYEQFVLHRRVFDDRVDLLHCPAYVMPHWCLKPVVINLHDVFALRFPGVCAAANRTHFQRMLPKSVARARRIVVPGTWVKRELLAWCGEVEDLRAGRKRNVDGQPVTGAEFLGRHDRVDPREVERRVRVIPWGLDARFRPVEDPAERERVALRHGLPPRYVLYVGRMEPKKNVRKLVEAFFAATASADLPHRLVMVGPRGWGVERQVRRLIFDLGIENRVVLPGFVPDADLPAIYSQADCLVFPSLAEGFGLPVLEAMACGTPVVAADIPPLRELAGGAACFARPDDLPGLRVSLEQVLTTPSLAAKLKTAGGERARNYTWREHGKRMIDLYREVILEDQRSRDRSE